MRHLFARMRDWLVEPTIASDDALDGFVTEAAARLAHRATVGYVEVKAGIHRRALWRDAEFVTRLEQSRWLAFAAVFADFLLVVEGFLRPEAADRAEDVRSWLSRTHAMRLAPGPFRGDGTETGAAFRRAFVERLAATALAPPADVSTHAPATARAIFTALPFHPEVTKLDYPVIESMIRFGSIGFWDRLVKRADREAIVATIRPAGEIEDLS